MEVSRKTGTAGAGRQDAQFSRGKWNQQYIESMSKHGDEGGTFHVIPKTPPNAKSIWREKKIIKKNYRPLFSCGPYQTVRAGLLGCNPRLFLL